MHKIKKRKIIALIISILIIFLVFLGIHLLEIFYQEKTYYVSSSSGSDNNDGLSIETAWKTVQKVNNYFFNKGDNILFKCGDIFASEPLFIKVGGTPKNPMNISSYGNGEKPNFQNSIECRSSNIENIILQNLDIGPVNSRFAIYFNKPGVKDVILRNISIHDGDVGIFIASINTYTIDSCDIYNCRDNAYVVYGSSQGQASNGLIIDCMAKNCGEGIMLHLGGSGQKIGPYHTIINCKVYNVTVEDAYDLTAGDEVELINCEAYNSERGVSIGHGITNLLIDGLKCDNANSFGIYIGESNGVTIRNSVVTNSGRETVRIYGRENRVVEHLEIHNCFFADKLSSERAVIRIGYPGSAYENNIHFHNNIIFSERNGSLVEYMNGSNLDNTNSYYNDNIWWQRSGLSSPFGRIYGIGTISFDWWVNKFPSDAFKKVDYVTGPLLL